MIKSAVLDQSLYKIYPTENVDNYQYKSFNNDEEASNFCEVNGYVRYKEIKEQPFEKRLNSSRNIDSSRSAIESFPVSEAEAEDIDNLRETFPDKEDLRVVLEDYFHIYDDYAQFSVQEFDSYFEDYMKDEVTSSRIIKSSLSDTSYEVVEEDNIDDDGGTYFILVSKDPWCIIGVDVSGEVGMDSSYYNDVDIGDETYRKYGEWDTSSLNVKSHIYSVEFNIDEETVDEETFMKALKLTKEEFDTLVERVEDLAMGTWEDWVRENYDPE